MQPDKRPHYTWWITLLGNIITHLGFVVYAIFNGWNNGTNRQFYLFRDVIETLNSVPYQIGAAIFLGISLLPLVLISRNFIYKKAVVFGIPVVMALAGLHQYWLAETCSGKMCGLGHILLVMALGIAIVVYTISYLTAYYLRKWNEKVAAVVVKIGIIIVIVELLYLGLFFAPFLGFSI